ncbi:hypothetical protein AMTRI_Chr03g144560 [Amborella trichopoda]
MNLRPIGKRKCTFASTTIQKLLQLLKEEKVRNPKEILQSNNFKSSTWMHQD